MTALPSLLATSGLDSPLFGGDSRRPGLVASGTASIPVPGLERSDDPVPPRTDPVTLKAFMAFGLAAFGPSWRKPLALRLGWSISHMTRVLSANRPIPSYLKGFVSGDGTEFAQLRDVLDSIAEERIEEIRKANAAL